MKAISGVKFATTFNGYEHSAHSMRLLRIGSTPSAAAATSVSLSRFRMCSSHSQNHNHPISEHHRHS